MKVKELIEELKKYPEDLTVVKESMDDYQQVLQLQEIFYDIRIEKRESNYFAQFLKQDILVI